MTPSPGQPEEVAIEPPRYDGALAAWNGKWTDVEESAYFDAIAFIAWYMTPINETLFAGTTPTTFGPKGTMTRGDFMTVLHKLAGRPEAVGDENFDDIAADDYYHDAVLWGCGTGIVAGKGSNRFAPRDALTRQEMAIILSKYAAYAGLEIEKLRDLPADLKFDAWADADGHITALAEAGMLTSGGYNLTQAAPREEIAQMFEDFVWFILRER